MHPARAMHHLRAALGCPRGAALRLASRPGATRDATTVAVAPPQGEPAECTPPSIFNDVLGLLVYHFQRTTQLLSSSSVNASAISYKNEDAPNMLASADIPYGVKLYTGSLRIVQLLLF